MKSRIFMYLFIFTALISLYQFKSAANYVTNTQLALAKYQETADEYSKTSAALKKATAALEVAKMFDLSHNKEALKYFETYENVTVVSATVTEALLQNNLNTTKRQALIPFTSSQGEFKFSTIRVLNHKWLMASFSDGVRSGEAIIEYSLKGKEVKFNTLKSLLHQ